MRQAYDYWQDQPGTYHRRRARPRGPARQGAGPNARSRALRPGLTPGPLALRRQAHGLSPVQAASDARARLPAPRRSVPQAGPGAELPMRGGPHGRSLASPRPAPPSASARSRRLRMPGRISPRLGGACLRPARGPSCPCGVAPTGARSPAPGLRHPQPQPGPGGFGCPGASPRASEERASGRPGGRAAHAGWPPRALARQPPACAALSLSPVQAASDARARLPAPRRSVPQAGPGAELPMRGGPHGRSLASPRPAPPSASARSRRLQTPGRVSPRLGGACLRPARGPSCPCGVAPAGARSPAPGLRRPQPQPGPGGFRRPGASPPRLGGARLRPGWGPSCPCGVAPSGARSPAPGLRRPRLARPRPRLLLVHTFGAPAPPRVNPWRAPQYCQAAYCDSDEGVRPVGHSQRPSPGTAAPTERHLQVRGGHLSPHARLDATAHRRQDTDAPRPAAVGVRSWRPGRRQRPCHRALCVLTRRGCPILYVPAQCAPAKTEALLPSRFREGTRDLLPSQNGRGGARPPPPPLPFSGGEERRARPRPRPGSRLSAAHLPTGGEEECTGTADTNPGSNYLVRGYSPSMHYFYRGDMPHFSPPLPFQPRAGARPRRARSGAPACAGLWQSPTPAAGASSTSVGLSEAPAGGGQWWSPDPRSRRAFDLGRPERGASACRAAVVPEPRGRRAVDLGRPEQGARTCQAAAVTQPLRRACRRPWPARQPCRRGPARRSPSGPSAAGRDRRNLKLARRTGRWPAEASAGPRRRRPCPIFTLLLILLTTPS